MIEAARRIGRWLYNYNMLHAMMRSAIDGELVRWNTIRFDTNYMFLENTIPSQRQVHGVNAFYGVHGE
jgi:hypothetical protein